MTVNKRKFHAAATAPAIPNGRHAGEAALQAYVRHLHEQRNRHNHSDEPVRGKDPWNGIGL
jgi:hypothetical protein